MTDTTARGFAGPGLTSSPRLPRAVWAASAVALLANSADTYALFVLLWIAGPQGWSGAQTALVVLALRLPTLISGPLVGRAVDRWGARPIMRLDMTGRALLVALMAMSGRGETLALVPVLVLGGLAGSLSPATYAAVRTLIPRLVGGQQLGRANAVVALSDQMPLLLGAVLVGPSLILLGPTTSLLVAVVMLLIGVALTFQLPHPSPSGGRQHQEADATRLPARRWPAHLVALVSLSVTYYFVYGPFETATPPLVRDQLHGNEATYGLLWVVFGIGALITLPIGPVLARWRPGVVNALGAVVWGLVMLPIAFVHDPVVVSVLFFVGGMVWGPYTTIETTAVQRWVDPSRHGAVFGLQRSLLASATPVGAALGALALSSTSPAVVLGISCRRLFAGGTAGPHQQGPTQDPLTSDLGPDRRDVFGPWWLPASAWKAAIEQVGPPVLARFDQAPAAATAGSLRLA